LDNKLEMEYCLHIFVYNNHGELDAPLVIPNWGESDVLTIALDRKDDFLGRAVTVFSAKAIGRATKHAEPFSTHISN